MVTTTTGNESSTPPPSSSARTTTSMNSILRKSLKFSSTGKSSTNDENPTNIDEISKIVGYVNEEYKCVHNNFSGILYAGPLALVFLGRIFFFEWTVVIKWEDAVHVTKHEADTIRVEVRAPKKKGTIIYDFEQVFNREKAWSALVSLHNDTIIDTPRRPAPTPRQLTRSLRRNNSDPLQISQVFDFSEPALAVTGDIFSPKSRKASISRSVSGPTPEVGSGSVVVGSTSGNTTTSDMSSDSFSSSSPGKQASKRTLTKAWSDILDNNATLYSETAVESRELSCDLDSFFNFFVKDGAEYSIVEFMKANGDEDIDCSMWRKQQGGDIGQSRVIQYTHPVNAPMAPPKARARKEQTLRRFGKLGLVIETKTFVDDVPMTDCFYVADMIRVEAVGDKVSINMRFEITFVKSTMFKSIITRTTKGEFQGFSQNFVNFMAKKLGDAAAIPPPEPTQQVPPPQTTTFNGSVLQQITVLLCASIFLLQVWMLMEMRAMRVDILQLQSSSSASECISTTIPPLDTAFNPPTPL